LMWSENKNCIEKQSVVAYLYEWIGNHRLLRCKRLLQIVRLHIRIDAESGCKPC
jgi:hypothetical protein